MHIIRIAAVIVTIAGASLFVPPVRSFAVDTTTKTVDSIRANAENAQFDANAKGNENKVAADIAAAYNVPISQINQLHASGWGYGEIEMMYALAKASGQTPAQVQALRQSGLGWGEIGQRLHLSLGHIQHLGRIVAGHSGRGTR